MNLVIPSEIQIGAIKYRIVFSDKLLKKMSDRASMNIKEEIIRLQNGCSAAQLFANLMHEIDHLAEDTAGISQEEQDSIARANLVAQALLSMGIEPDFSQIPEEEL